MPQVMWKCHRHRRKAPFHRDLPVLNKTRRLAVQFHHRSNSPVLRLRATVKVDTAIKPVALRVSGSWRGRLPEPSKVALFLGCMPKILTRNQGEPKAELHWKIQAWCSLEVICTVPAAVVAGSRADKTCKTSYIKPSSP